MSTTDITLEQAQEIYNKSLSQLKEAAINIQIPDEHILTLRKKLSNDYRLLLKLQRKKKYGIFAFFITDLGDFTQNFQPVLIADHNRHHPLHILSKSLWNNVFTVYLYQSNMKNGLLSII